MSGEFRTYIGNSVNDDAIVAQIDVVIDRAQLSASFQGTYDEWCAAKDVLAKERELLLKMLGLVA